MSPSPAKPTVPADVPTTGPNLRKPGERPPVEPVAATKHTSAGAKAFAEFFIRTIDWGFATTSGAYMRHYFQPSCVECRSHASSLDATHKKGDHYIGGRFIITGTRQSGAEPERSELTITVSFNITALEAVDAKGTFKDAEPAHHSWHSRLRIAWGRSAWSVVDMDSGP
jgi:hypothetical protein